MKKTFLRKQEIALVTAALILSIAFGLIPTGARFFTVLYANGAPSFGSRGND